MTITHTRDIASPGRLTRRPVVEVMTIPAPLIGADVSLAQALASMMKLGVRNAAVVDDRGRCIGILTERMALSTWADRSPGARRTVAAALPPMPAVIPTRWVVQQAARYMNQCGVDAVAVTDPQGRPVGVLTGSDLVALLGDPAPRRGGEDHAIDT